MKEERAEKECGNGDASSEGDTRPGKHEAEGIPLGSRERFDRLNDANPEGWGSDR
jgi:hypothetical protein